MAEPSAPRAPLACAAWYKCYLGQPKGTSAEDILLAMMRMGCAAADLREWDGPPGANQTYAQVVKLAARLDQPPPPSQSVTAVSQPGFLRWLSAGATVTQGEPGTGITVRLPDQFAELTAAPARA
jgi:hypothetical protein